MYNQLTLLLKKSILEHLLFAVLAILAVVFFEERLCADSSYYLMRVINHESFWVEHNRFVLVFSQWLPLLAVKLGFGLKTVLWLYSIGHVLFFYFIFLITRYIYHNYQTGFLLILIQTLGIMSGFFVPMFELYYCAALLVLFSVILHDSNRLIDKWLLAGLSFFILTGHPYASLLMALIVVLHFLENKWKKWTSYGLIALVFVGVFIFKKYHVTEYERGKTLAFLNNLQHAKYDFAYLKALLKFLMVNYWELLLLGFLTGVVLIKRKYFWRGTAIALIFLLTLAMVNVSYYGFELSRYQEQVYFPLSFIVAYAFVQYVWKTDAIQLKGILTVLVLVLIAFRLSGIIHEGKEFSDRVNEIKAQIAVVKKQDGTKFVIHERNLKYSANWSYPIESMLFSSYDTKEETVTICTNEDHDFEQNNVRLTPNLYLFRRWEMYPIYTVNKRYFKLDKGDYKVLY